MEERPVEEALAHQLHEIVLMARRLLVKQEFNVALRGLEQHFVVQGVGRNRHLLLHFHDGPLAGLHTLLTRLCHHAQWQQEHKQQ
jgi:hypothetical protein